MLIKENWNYGVWIPTLHYHSEINQLHPYLSKTSDRTYIKDYSSLAKQNFNWHRTKGNNILVLWKTNFLQNFQSKPKWHVQGTGKNTVKRPYFNSMTNNDVHVSRAIIYPQTNKCFPLFHFFFKILSTLSSPEPFPQWWTCTGLTAQSVLRNTMGHI